MLQRIKNLTQIASSVEIMDCKTNANKCEFFSRIVYKFKKKFKLPLRFKWINISFSNENAGKT